MQSFVQCVRMLLSLVGEAREERDGRGGEDISVHYCPILKCLSNNNDIVIGGGK